LVQVKNFEEARKIASEISTNDVKTQALAIIANASGEAEDFERVREVIEVTGPFSKFKDLFVKGTVGAASRGPRNLQEAREAIIANEMLSPF
jgi:hypothetical protein